MIRYVATLDASALDEVVAQTHATWGRGRDLGRHRDALAERIARSDGRLRLAGLRDGSDLVCSLQRYDLSLDTPAGPRLGVGIGSVFTPAAQRGRGHARRLIREVLRQAEAEGRSLALVHSNIGTKFYEALGFRPLTGWTWSCRVEALPTSGALPCAPAAPEALCELREGSFRGPWLRLKRTAQDWRFGAWRNRCGASWRLGTKERPRGWVVARQGQGDVFWIDDAWAVDREALWATFRAMAETEGAHIVAGWLRPDVAGCPFVATRRTRCRPMAAPLDDALVHLASWRSHFSSLDHF